MTVNTRPCEVIVDDSIDDEQAGLCQVHLDAADREQVTRQILQGLGDRFDEDMEPSSPGHTIAEVLDAIGRNVATATRWELIGPQIQPAPALVALVPVSPSCPAVSRHYWISLFDRPASADQFRVMGVIELDAAGRTALLSGIVRGMHALFDPVMGLRKAALPPPKRVARSTGSSAE